MNPSRIFYWVGLTVGQPFNTGVQRVTRCLAVALQKQGIEVIPVKWNGDKIAPISAAEAKHLAKWGGPVTEPYSILPHPEALEWLLLPEITLPVMPTGSNVAKLGKSLGLQVAAVFYDLIPLKTPEFYNAATLAHLERYWETFAEVTVALPISRTAASDLTEWLADRGLFTPAIRPCLLSGELPGIPRSRNVRTPPLGNEPLRLLAVGSLEPRKNYPRILRALGEARQATGRDIRLTIVGRQMREHYDSLHREIVGLAASLGDGVVILHPHLDDRDMESISAVSDATIFGSWIEGFGLPVHESLWLGLPCICHDGSALAEVAPGGGTLMVNMLDVGSIAHALTRLATEDGLLARLSAEAVERSLSTWDDYGRDVLAALNWADIRNHLNFLQRYDPLGYCLQ